MQTGIKMAHSRSQWNPVHSSLHQKMEMPCVQIVRRIVLIVNCFEVHALLWWLLYCFQFVCLVADAVESYLIHQRSLRVEGVPGLRGQGGCSPSALHG